MNSISHILNGDALKQGFPKGIPGELIIVRECLMEGDISGRDLDGFFASRVSWLGEAYNESRENYNRRVKQEFEKILNLDKKSEINLWFEEDLFCQVNLWFVCYLLKLIGAENVYLIKPESQGRYGFGGYGKDGLEQLYKNREVFDCIEQISELWNAYQAMDHGEMMAIANFLEDRLPFIKTAVEAHLARLPKGNDPGRPVRTLLQLMNELGEDDFGRLFREFSKRESIYGYGDLQVKAMLEKIRKRN